MSATNDKPRQREGDQPLPVPNDGPSMHDLVIEDVDKWGIPKLEATAIRQLLLERKRIGLDRYGSLLQAGNGRDWRRDLLEELADAAVYARQGLAESGAGADLGEAYHFILSALFWAQKIPGQHDGDTRPEPVT